REFSVLVSVGTLQDLYAVSLQLRQEFVQVVDAVVDHEAGGTRAEPLGVLVGDMPHGDAVARGLVVGPFENRAAPRLALYSPVLVVPLRELLVIVGGLKKHTADPCDLRHQASIQLRLPERRVARALGVGVHGVSLSSSADSP